MKKLVLIYFLLLLVAACQTNTSSRQAQEEADSLKDIRVEYGQGPAIIKFDTIYYDLGSLDINGPDQTRDYFFANIGGSPLVIENVDASCPCLDITSPKDSILPGRKSKITMTLRMKEMSSGQFYRSAYVYTNASEEPIEIIMQGIKCYE